MKDVLITGAGGFIGSHLTEKLVKEGASVRAFVHYNSLNSWGWLDTVPPDILKEIEVFSGDIRDPWTVRQAIKGVRRIFHLAALIGIPYSYHSPESYVDTNIMGTLNVLQAAKEEGSERVLITSTSEIYGSAVYVPIDEKHPIQAQSPYSATKIGADRIGEAFHKSFDLAITIVRPFNTYGPRQSARAIIPALMCQLLSGMHEIKAGHLDQTRDFNFVADICQGFLDIANIPKTIGEEINLGTGLEISLRDLAQKIVDIINPCARIVFDENRTRPAKSEVTRLVANSNKARALTGWTPQCTLEQGLRMTVDWMRLNLDHYKADIHNF
jgi:NAD dependent epimerase/dehydratase